MPTKQYDQPQPLMLKTIELMKEKDLVQVSYNTGLPYMWLTKFASGIYLNPSCNRVVVLYEHLTNTKLV